MRAVPGPRTRSLRVAPSLLALLALAFVAPPAGADAAVAGGDAAVAGGDAAVAGANRASLVHLHVEANEGGSSGGHTALRVGRYAYHFQHRDEMLLLQRDDAHVFVHAYAGLGNRRIHARSIEVSDATQAKVREGFDHRLRAQKQQLDRLSTARAERALADAVAADPTAPIAVRIRGAGLFDDTAPASAPTNPALLALRDQVARRYGADFGQRRAAQLRTEQALDLPSAPAPLPDTIDVYTLLPPDYPYALRTRDRIGTLAALERLGDPRPLAPGVLRDAGPVSEPDRRALCDAQAAQHSNLVDLAGSRRPDLGPVLLIGMARLAALDDSCTSGRLRVVDAYADDAELLPAPAPGVLVLATAEEANELESAWAALRADPGSERRLTDLEQSANVWLELSSAPGAQHVRAVPDPLVPSRRAQRDASPPALPTDALRAWSRDAAQADRELVARLRALHHYSLVRRNCVSELFATLHASFEEPRRDSERELGGWVDPARSLAFIPFVSGRDVGRRYRVARSEVIPSQRDERITEMRERERDVVALLRESNTLTARGWAPNQRDSLFLFFTQDAVWPRPLLGAINLAVGIGGAALGILSAPVDGGDLFMDGVRGAVMSLPELGFVNMRKGSYDWAPRTSDHAQSSQGSSASRSARSTVAPPHTRKPTGASR